MKHLIRWSACLFLLFPLYTISQHRIPFEGPFIDVAYKKIGAIKGCVGILNEEYILRENSYGRGMDFNNNILTYISIFSVKTGTLKHRFNLNDIIASSGKGANNILVNDVIIWKGKLVAFYTYKNPGGKTFLVDAVILDTKGIIIKKVEDIGVIRHRNEEGSFLGQGGLIVNGRNTLSVAREFKYKMNPDSTSILVYTTPDKAEGNIRFLVYNDDLILKEDITLSVPLREKEAGMIDFDMDIEGNIFLLIKTQKSKSVLKENPEGGSHYFDLFIRGAKDKSLLSMPISIDQKLVIDASLLVNKEGAFCYGTFSQREKKNQGWAKGTFFISVNQGDPLESTVVKMDLSNERIAAFNERLKKKERVDGIPYGFTPYQVLPDGFGGFFLIQSCETIDVQVRGRTGALNSYVEATRAYLITHIGNDKKIKWVNGFGKLSTNIELYSRLNRPLFYVKNGGLSFIRTFEWSTENKTTLLSIINFNKETGEYENTDVKDHFALSPQHWEFETLEKSMIKLNEKEFILTLFHGKIALVRIDP